MPRRLVALVIAVLAGLPAPPATTTAQRPARQPGGEAAPVAALVPAAPAPARPRVRPARVPPLRAAAEASPAGDEAPRARHVRFGYEAVVEGLVPGAVARVWVPLPRTGPHQQVELVDLETPGPTRATTGPRFGNSLLYVEAPADPRGEVPLRLVFDVRREAVPPDGEPLDPAARELFLEPDAMVPSDAPELDGLLVEDATGAAGTSGAASASGSTRATDASAAAAGADATRALARRLYDIVDDRVRYDKPAGGDWGRGDALWVCGSGYGNCTDFHSLFIALCRHEAIPGRFEIGFPLPADATSGEVGGYHCWAWFADGDRWVPVDISEADKHPELKSWYFGHLSADRIAFSVGRDLVLEPPQDGPPVNFLVYPYVEVDGKPWTGVRKRFHFEDVADDGTR